MPAEGDKPDEYPYDDRGAASTGWFVGTIVALALLAIGYLVFSANTNPSAPAAQVTGQ